MHSIRTSLDIVVALTKMTIFSLCLAMFVGTVRAESALEPCPEVTSVPWHKCFGTFEYDNGTKYVGEFRADMRNGKGTFTYPDGAKYEGDFVNNDKKGQGTFTWPNGAKYVGAFDNGTANGEGTEYDPEGAKVRSGIWVNGEYTGGEDTASSD